MHYFIYPNGEHSKMLDHQLHLLNHTTSFLDDFKENMGLAQNLDFIKQNNTKVLLACDLSSEEGLKIKEKLILNLQKYNIEYVDGFLHIMNDINSYIKDLNNPQKVLFAVHMYGRIDKRYTSLYFDNNNHINTIYIFSQFDEFSDYLSSSSDKKTHICLCIPLEYINYLENLDFILTNYYMAFENKKNDNIILLSHGYASPLGYLCYEDIGDKNFDNVKLLIRKNMPYMFVSSKQNYNLANDFYEKFYGEKTHKFIKIGYPALDENMKNYAMLKEEKLDRVLIATRSYRCIHLLKPAIKALLSLGYKVHFRTHPIDNHENFNDFADSFLHEKNFIVDMDYKGYKQSKFTMDILNKTLCVISDYSSFAFTLPCTNLRPCILFYPDDILQKTLNQNINGNIYSFYDSRVHILTKNSDEVVNSIKNLDLKKYKKSIKSYIKDEIYNPKASAKAIVEFILKKR